MNLHVAGVLGLLLCFAVCALRPVNLGAACLAMTFLVGSLLARESVGQMLSGFPAELFVVLAGVTYLFAVAAGNGTVDGVVAWGARALGGPPAPAARGACSRWPRCPRSAARSAPRAWRCWRPSR